MEETPQKLFRLPGTIEEEEEREQQHEVQGVPIVVENPTRADSPLLGQKGTLSSLPRNLTLVRVSTQSSSIGGGVVRQDSTRSRYRAGPTRKLRRRAVLKNGECNVLQSRISRRSLRFLQDIFTTLVDTQWRWTLLCFTLSFLLSWLGFAVIWWLIAFTHGDFEERHLPPFQAENNWTPCIYNIFSFTSCFLFSIETQHTIGYGSRSTTEECPEAIFVMCIQSIAGVMIQAFMVGIVFAKMSRPKQRTQTLLFSRNSVICQRDGELCLMFRVGDMRKSHIIGAAVRAQVIRTRSTKEGEILSQNQQELAVGTDGQNENLFFIWPTTIIHKINSDSPFYNMSAEDMLTERFEVVVILEGTIESTGQTTQARSSYLPQEILWGHRFEPMVTYSKERQGYEVDYSLFNSTTQVDTPLCSGRELAEFYRVQDELRHGNGLITAEDIWADGYCCCGHRQLVIPNHFHRRSPIHSDSIKSDNSTEDSTLSRNAYKDPTYNPQESIPNPNTGQIFEIDPDGVQTLGEVDLELLPEAVNTEILRNSHEMTYDRNQDLETPKTEFPFLMKPNVIRKNSTRRSLSEEDRRSSNNSKRLCINIGNRIALSEEEKRLLNSRNVNGPKKHVLLAIDKLEGKGQVLHAGSKENLICLRRHTGSRERLDMIRKNVCAKGSKETPDLRTRRKLHVEQHDRVTIEREKSPKISFSPSLQRIIPCQNGRESPMESNSSYDKSLPAIPSECTRSAMSPISDFSPESGFYEGNQSSSSAETIRRDPRLPGNSIITRNRRSYENAQLQDVNQSLSRQSSASSSTDSDSPVKNLVNNIVVPVDKHEISPIVLRQIPCTNV